MTSTILVSLLLFLVTFLLSFLEAGALLGMALGGERRRQPKQERLDEAAPGVVSVGAVVAAMIILRAQAGIAFGVWAVGQLSHGKETNLFLVSTALSNAVLLAEVIGKLIAIRYPARARRAAQPLHRLLARVRPLWWRSGG